MEIKPLFSERQSAPLTWKNVRVPSCPSLVEAPEFWSETAIEIAAGKYFRQREGENSVRDLMSRVVEAITDSGLAQGYFAHPKAAQIFANELTHILLHQMGSFNSPVYFNVGIFPRFGVAGTGENHAWDPSAQAVRPTAAAYINPQASACFIQDLQDDLLSIFELLRNEAKLFKFGSGTGTNFSRLRGRGEPLVGGGESTGLISYLEIFDKAAQAIKSGGTTRRAAKMVVLDADHPEVVEFIQWKMHEERKARVLLANGYSGGMEGEAFRTVSGQNSNNSLRLTDAFLQAVRGGGRWALRNRRSGEVAREIPAAELFHQLARAAWECADPGVQFHDTIQSWHLCPNSAPIRASNPCSEYMFIDNSACNLASLNLVRFQPPGQPFDWEGFTQCARVLMIAQDILVDYASYPTAAIAENSHAFRPLGLGYANLGGLIMRQGLAYESAEAVDLTARITGALHAIALSTSQRLARARGPFARWNENREPALKVLARHHEAWRTLGATDLAWVDALYSEAREGAAEVGLRNAQVTLLAPTGTIGLLMDCDTLGIEPDFALIKRKYLAGGGELRLVNQAVRTALQSLNYAPEAVTQILRYIEEHFTPLGCPEFRPEHGAVFDCALPPTGHPGRRVSADGHLRIMAAAQPFLSGAISKTVNLPATTRVEEIEALYLKAWELGLKSLTIYRDSSKVLQPLCAEC